MGGVLCILARFDAHTPRLNTERTLPDMGTYIFKRILLFIPTLIAITIVTFLISRLAPGDPAELKTGAGGEGTGAKEVTAEMVEMIRKEWHLDKPIPQQYLIWV